MRKGFTPWKRKSSGQVIIAPQAILNRAPHIITGSQGTDTVLLDLEHGQYHVLNEVASRVWDLLATQATADAIVDTVRREFSTHAGSPPDRIAQDIRTLLVELQTAGLTTSGSGVRPTKQRLARAAAPSPTKSERAIGALPANIRTSESIGRGPSVVGCMLMLGVLKAALRTVGFGHTALWIRQKVRSIPASDTADTGRIKAIEHAVAMAGALYPGRALCLEQSLLLYYVLRRRGVRAVFRLGVLPHPFAAHAWIEYRGTPINDVMEHVGAFLPLTAEVL